MRRLTYRLDLTLVTDSFNSGHLRLHLLLRAQRGIVMSKFVCLSVCLSARLSYVGGVGSVVERRSLAGVLSLSAPDLQLTRDHSRGKPSTAGQPTRSTHPFIHSRSINE